MDRVTFGKKVSRSFEGLGKRGMGRGNGRKGLLGFLEKDRGLDLMVDISEVGDKILELAFLLLNHFGFERNLVKE
jgi:hypothetical protein